VELKHIWKWVCSGLPNLLRSRDELLTILCFITIQLRMWSVIYNSQIWSFLVNLGFGRLLSDRYSALSLGLLVTYIFYYIYLYDIILPVVHTYSLLYGPSVVIHIYTYLICGHFYYYFLAHPYASIHWIQMHCLWHFSACALCLRLHSVYNVLWNLNLFSLIIFYLYYFLQYFLNINK
jgi:hypothetical protein